MTNVKIISLGGSIIAPDRIDTGFLKDFRDVITCYIEKHKDKKFIIVTGGGGPARAYQKAYREISIPSYNETQDWIGIAATRLNAQLLKAVFTDLCPDDVITNPLAVKSFSGSILIASGWKPGFSTDNVAVTLAERFKTDIVINLSNIAKVYSDDPKKNPAAKPIDYISWKDFKVLAGDRWIPGKNIPFDPVATKKAAELNLRVITAYGKDLDNFKNILYEKTFNGTVIGPVKKTT